MMRLTATLVAFGLVQATWGRQAPAQASGASAPAPSGAPAPANGTVAQANVTSAAPGSMGTSQGFQAALGSCLKDSAASGVSSVDMMRCSSAFGDFVAGGGCSGGQKAAEGAGTNLSVALNGTTPHHCAAAFSAASSEEVREACKSLGSTSGLSMASCLAEARLAQAAEVIAKTASAAVQGVAAAGNATANLAGQVADVVGQAASSAAGAGAGAGADGAGAAEKPAAGRNARRAARPWASKAAALEPAQDGIVVDLPQALRGGGEGDALGAAGLLADAAGRAGKALDGAAARFTSGQAGTGSHVAALAHSFASRVSAVAEGIQSFVRRAAGF